MHDLDQHDTATSTTSPGAYFLRHLSNSRFESSASQDAVVGVFGVLLPALAIAAAATLCFDSVCGVLLRHPLETLIQAGTLMAIPTINMIVWHSLKQNDARNSKRLAVITGYAAGASLLSALVTTACIVLQYPLQESMTEASHFMSFLFLCATAWGAFGSSAYVAYALRNRWETEGARSTTVFNVILGLLLSFITVGASEARSAYIKYEENKAFGSDIEREGGLGHLRAMDCERDLRMDVANSKTEGLCGLFLRLDHERKRQIYYLVTGKPYMEYELDDKALASLPDSKLGSKIVGDVLPELSLSQSAIVGRISPQTLTSSIDWSFVFNNKGAQPREARAEFALPKDAVVSGMTMTVNGEEKRAVVAPAQRANDAYKWVVVEQRRDPAMVCDVGRGRILMQAYPIPVNSDVRINLSIKAPLTIENDKEASLALPRLIAGNFNKTSGYKLRMRSSANMQMNTSGGAKTTPLPSGENVLTTHFDQGETQGASLAIRIDRQDAAGPIAVLDRNLEKPGYILKWHKQVDVEAPKYVVAVVDSSAALKPYKEDVIKTLKKLDAKIPTSVIIASDTSEVQQEPCKVDRASALLHNMQFCGGKSNLKAVAAAAEEAGERKGGAVLWIHGPQPMESNEMVTTAPYLFQPAFYECAVDDGWTDTTQFFKNHKAIGPFVPVPHTLSVADDLDRQATKWINGGKEQIVRFVRWNAYNGKVISGSAADEVTCLWANGQLKRFMEKSNPYGAAQMASIYQLVSPISSAVVLELASDYQRFGINEHPLGRTTDNESAAHEQLAQGQMQFSRSGARAQLQRMISAAPIAQPATMTAASIDEGFSSAGVAAQAAPQSPAIATAPALQGATNGVIGPQGSDATYVMGVNTAGTVRVNNLANLEAMLNSAGCLGELFGIGLGLPLALLALLRPTLKLPGFALGASGRFIMGSALVLFGLALPGFLNYMVASARDANLFS